MYATRPLSMYRKDPSFLSTPPPEFLYSGYLVVTDEESEAEDVWFWGLLKATRFKNLPFPQNKVFKFSYTTGGKNSSTHTDKVWLVPVLDLPLSANRYYVICAEKKHEGQAWTCSTEEDMGRCCFCTYISDVKPKKFDHRNRYQQVEISKRRGSDFIVKSVVPDGFPPYFLRRRGSSINSSKKYNCQLGKADGLDVSLRKRLPDFNFPLSNKCSATVIVGKWYCPFVFVREEGTLKDQMKKTLFYEITLEQQWEEIYRRDNEEKSKDNNIKVMDLKLVKEEVSLYGVNAMKMDETNGMIWYKQVRPNGEGLRLGLSSVIVEKMKLIQENGGWNAGGEDARVDKVEEFKGENGWKRFGCFVLVERFALRSLDGNLMLTCDFKHINQIQSRWE
ncbi:hypothetical protein GIB67_038542 [Kingdonia uniflora]|uniref:Uncharacterized protein n=1 Tax=Kingdonia uniflora TaxID=39325 RepID=A0A7J7NPC9_9MAGN|nr:hypothetical protein GIB67_038542 [Kingdonia uniflora]